jgi:hypothetical protein
MREVFFTYIQNIPSNGIFFREELSVDVSEKATPQEIAEAIQSTINDYISGQVYVACDCDVIELDLTLSIQASLSE